MKTGSKIGLIAVTFFSLFLASCEPDKPNYSIIPYIEFKSHAINADGSLRLSFTFKDGDADLGRPRDEGQTLFCEMYKWNTTDQTWDLVINSSYFIDPMDGGGLYHPYEGEILVDIPEPYAVPPKSKYKCWVVDRAGHRSNEVYSDEIYP
jgi:hypothetical protein